jgi:hypothetical protein
MLINFVAKKDCDEFSDLINYYLDNYSDTIVLDHDYSVKEVVKRKTSYKDLSLRKTGNRIWEKYWDNMPEFEQFFNPCYNQLTIEGVPGLDLKSEESLKYLSEILGQRLTKLTKSCKFPFVANASYKTQWFRGGDELKNNFPIYIPSLGRYDCSLTANALNSLGIDNYFIIVEEQEYEDYARYHSKERLLILDPQYIANYETLDGLGTSKRVGSGAARNFAWDHSISNGYTWHWILDDNISGFARFYDNKKVRIKTSAIFPILENHTLRFSNVGMSGMNYRFFAVQNRPAFQLNTRVYSCIFIRNDVPFRWRGRLNEDTILSLDMILGGYNTLLYNVFLIDKLATQTLKGGNYEAFYKNDGTYDKTKLLCDVHPQYAKMTTRFNRTHHSVNYRQFENIRPLELVEGLEIPKGVNNYGIYFG